MLDFVHIPGGQRSKDKTKTLPLLDGSMEIGLLYNGKTDQPIYGKNLFIDPKSKAQSLDFVKSDSVIEDRKTNRIEELDINAELSLSVLSGLVKVQ